MMCNPLISSSVPLIQFRVHTTCCWNRQWEIHTQVPARIDALRAAEAYRKYQSTLQIRYGQKTYTGSWKQYRENLLCRYCVFCVKHFKISVAP